MVRSGVMFVILLAVTLLTGNFSGVSEIKGRAVTYIILSGAAGAASWLFYFYALKLGRAGQVVAIDRFSVVLAIGLAAIFLGEHASTKTIFGAVLITAGAILVAVG